MIFSKSVKYSVLDDSNKSVDITVFYSDILRLDSTNADALYVRGLCLYYEDCIDKAVQFFMQALRMAPDHEKARLACRVWLLFSHSSSYTDSLKWLGQLHRF